MTVLSKLNGRSLSYNCYELLHTWTPYCNEAALDVGYSIFIEGLKLYFAMYSVYQIFYKKFSPKDFLNTARSTLISSFFLGFNGFAFTGAMCLFRKWFGRFYFSTFFLSGFISCFLAIVVERKQRQGPLALYVANCASESLFRMAVARGLITPVPKGEIILFAAAISLFCYIARKHRFSSDPVSFVIKYLLGDEEAKGKDIKCMKEDYSRITSTDPEQNVNEPNSEEFPWKTFRRWMKTKHWSCSHNFGCIKYSLLGFLRPFAIGCSTSLGIQCLSLVRRLISKPSGDFGIFDHKRCLRMGLFLGGFSWSYRTINCIFRWLFDKDKAEYALLAALIGGFFMTFTPNTTLTFYMTWKTIEVLFDIGIEIGTIPKISGFMLFLYAISGGVIFHALILEPHNLRTSYRKFILRISHNLMAQGNVRLLDAFRTHASKLNPDFWPHLDRRYVSKIYQEAALSRVFH